MRRLRRLKQFSALETRKRTKAICVVAVVAVLIATLWPFNASPRNGVTWLHESTGLKFEKAGLVVTRGPLRPVDTEAESFSLELLLRPASTRSAYTILAFYTPTRPRQLLVRQWTDGLLLVTHDAAVENDKTKRSNLTWITFSVGENSCS